MPGSSRPRCIGGFSWSQLALASLLSLFMEMLMIRWVAAEVSAFAYFKNVVLIACFLGFGLGCYLSRKSINLLAFVFPVCLLVTLIKLPWHGLRQVIVEIPYFIAPTSQVYLWGMPAVHVGITASLSAIVLIVFLFALIAFVFVPLGQIVGWSLEHSSNGILAYTVNVLASLAGILLYTLLCFLYQPPPVWFAFSGIVAAILLWKVPRLRGTSAAAFLFCVGFAAFGPAKPVACYGLHIKRSRSRQVRASRTRSPTIYRPTTAGTRRSSICLPNSPQLTRNCFAPFRCSGTPTTFLITFTRSRPRFWCWGREQETTWPLPFATAPSGW